MCVDGLEKRETEEAALKLLLGLLLLYCCTASG
jgi:hypothetical protein